MFIEADKEIFTHPGPSYLNTWSLVLCHLLPVICIKEVPESCQKGETLGTPFIVCGAPIKLFDEDVAKIIALCLSPGDLFSHLLDVELY